MTTKLRKRARPDAAEFARDTIEKFPNVMAHLAEAEYQEKIAVLGEESVSSDDGDRARPDFAKIASEVAAKYPTVLAHLAEIERQETGERKDTTEGDETSEGPKS